MILKSEAKRPRAGAALARVARGGDVITLSGPLGVGKTALARGLHRRAWPWRRSAEPELRDRSAL